MIKTLLLHPLGPSLVLALGGLLLIPLRHRGRSPERPRARWALPVAFLVLILAGATLLALRRNLPGTLTTLQWSWQPLTVAGSSLTWNLDGWNWLVALLILCVAAATLALQEDPIADRDGPLRAQGTLWLAAAGLAFVFSDNLVTLATCWVVLDGAIALRLMPAESAEPAGRAWSLISLAGLALVVSLVFLGETNARATLTGGLFPRLSLALLGLAALVRAGAYPFHYWLMGREHLDPSDRMALHLVGPMTGIWLLARIQQLAGPDWLHGPEWAALGTLAVLGTSLAAWVASDPGEAWRWVAINRASLVVLTAFVAGMAGPAALVWPLVTFSLGTGLLALGLGVRTRWQWSLPAWLGALAVWGLPGTPGFLARWVLVLPNSAAARPPSALASLPASLLLFGMVLISEILLVAALWELVTGPSETPQDTASAAVTAPRPAVLRLGATTVLLAVPVILWGFAPRQPAILAGLVQGSGLPWSLLQALGEARRSVWAGLLVAGVGGALLGWLRPQIFTGMRGWQEGITRVVSLEWLYRGIGMTLGFAGTMLQYFSRLGEGEGYLGWMALAVLLLLVLLRI